MAGGGGGKPRRFGAGSFGRARARGGHSARRGPVASSRAARRRGRGRAEGGRTLWPILLVGVPDVRLHLRGWRRDRDHARGSGEWRGALWMALPLDPDPGARAAPADLGLGLLRARRRHPGRPAWRGADLVHAFDGIVVVFGSEGVVVADTRLCGRRVEQRGEHERAHGFGAVARGSPAAA